MQNKTKGPMSTDMGPFLCDILPVRTKKCKILLKKFADLFFRRIFAVPKDNRGVAQLVSASGLGPEGPVFESQYPDKKEQLIFNCSFFCISLTLSLKYNGLSTKSGF